ncbi:MAG: glycosyltransferase family 4 protein [Mediterranea massiliensis]|nr:glycosyltransferase family 4 protein [Mediterranea massiliensis]
MNIYIILNHGLVDVGGGQLYVSSKKRYMEELGYRVLIFSFAKGEIVIPNLKVYKKDIIPELQIYPMYFRTKAQQKIVSLMSKGISPNDNVFIESNSVTLSLWGELLAKRLNAKHIIYNLNENIHVTSSLFNFFSFKLNRKEIAGISTHSIPNFFKDYIDGISGEETCLKAHHDYQQVADIDYDIPKELYDKSRINVCICGRLVKAFVSKAVEKFAEYALNHSEMEYNLVIIGDDEYHTNFKTRFKCQFEKIKNVNCFMVGFMYPIPRKLLRIMNYGISSAGAVTVLSREGIKTLSIDCNDLLPIGIRGITTVNNLYRETETAYDYKYWFDKLFLTKEFENIQIELPPLVKDNYKKLSEHTDFLVRSASVKEYFTDFGKVSIYKKIVVALFGFKSYYFLYTLLNK